MRHLVTYGYLFLGVREDVAVIFLTKSTFLFCFRSVFIRLVYIRLNLGKYIITQCNIVFSDFLNRL